MDFNTRQVHKRQRIGALLYRDGPSSYEDESFFAESQDTESDAPKGLNCNQSMIDINKSVTEKELAGSEVLLVYFAEIGASATENIIDLDYIETLIEKSGANVNFQDSHGQSLMHEVALRWPVELAELLLSHGADIDHRDFMGRTPLHVAATINAPNMVKWLVANGAAIHARTEGEEQTPIHYATKNNAVETISMLLDLGAKIGDRDYKERTPLLLAAETGREDAARVLLERGAPAGVYDDTGCSCITYMIETMPDVAAQALEQFYHVDSASKTAYYYLAYLETQKWENSRIGNAKGMRITTPMEPLEQIIRCNEDRLIMHPSVQRLITKKRELYGNRQFYTQLLVNFIFTLIWTILTAIFPKLEPKKNNENVFYDSDKSVLAYPRMVLEITGLAMALYAVIVLKLDSSRISERFDRYKSMRMMETIRDYQYCHPRYPQELNLVKDRVEFYNAQKPASLYDAWYYMDVAAILGLVTITVTRVLCLAWSATGPIISAHQIIYVMTLVVLWLRFMKCFRPFIALGPFIAMLGFIVMDTLKFACLFFEFYIPYTCALWLIFGGYAGEQWRSFRRTGYEVFRMTLVDSFNFGDLTEADISLPKLPAQLICGTYFALVSMTCLNLYIALISETFASVYGNATATAYMLQGEVLISSEQKMSYTNLSRLKNYIESTCSPEVVMEQGSAVDEEAEALREIKSEIKALRRKVEKVKKNQSTMRKAVTTVSEQIDQILQQQTIVNTKSSELANIASGKSEKAQPDRSTLNNMARLQNTMQEIASVFGK